MPCFRLVVATVLAACVLLLSLWPSQAAAQDGLVSLPGVSAGRLPGQAGGDRFGRAVAGVGDMNGDGFADVIVGADLNDGGGAIAGRAYVYYGGPLSSTTPDLVLTGEASGDQFGYAVASAGDVNGDGFDDVIVGAFSNDSAGPNAGRAYVFFGGLTADATPDLILSGEAADDWFGASVAGAGDVNGDGFDDLLVGANGNDAGGTTAGRAYLFFGGASPDAVADLTLTGEAAGDEFGHAISSAGDVNGDGYTDLFIGAWHNNAGGPDAGRAYVFFGGPGLDASPDLTLTGEADFDYFGNALASAGDMNGDGAVDLLVAASGSNLPVGNAGRAYVFFGGVSLDATPDLIFEGEAAGDRLGTAVAGVGDMNGDSYADVAVGADNSAAGGAGAGRAYVFFGGPTADATADLMLTGNTGDRMGTAIAGAGDMDGDGLTDLIVGAREVDTVNGVDSGAAYLVSNANTGSGLAEWRAFGEAASDEFGISIADAGDVNGDGYADIIVGAEGNDTGGDMAGRAYIFFGGPGFDTTPDLTLTGQAAGDWFGISVSGAGDVNGDGYDDVIVGASQRSLAASAAGRAYLFFGGSAADATPDLVFTGEAAGDQFGDSVSGAGDVNGDGFADVIVGASLNDARGSAAGRAYIFHGGPTADAIPDRTFSGTAASDLFGTSVSGAGDVNGDGFADVIIGASGHDAGGTDAGGAYVIYGGPGTSFSYGLRLTGEAEFDGFGVSVSGAGDVNGDGYHDVIVGARYSDSPATQAGSAYVFYGGPGADIAPDLILSGEGSQDYFGRSVSGAGDVNGDGYDDVVVGADGNSAGGSNAGRAYVYYGGPGADSASDITVTGETSNDRLGLAVAGAGDTSGNGRSGVLVGVYGDDATGSNAGSAQMYRATGPGASPGLNRLADVPGDQGGVLQARWTRSGSEMTGHVASYRVERSEPAGTGGYAWETVAVEGVSGNTQYSHAVPTYSDQTGTNPGTTCVRVTAQGTRGETWRSTVKCAASIDNLAPGAPASVALGASPDGDVALTWDEVTGEPDLFGYDVFRSTDATCDASDPLAGSASAPGFEDDGTVFGTDAWYCVAARDVHGNRSAATGPVSANPAVLAAVKVVLEGAYQFGLAGGALMRSDLEDVLPMAHPFSGAPWNHTGTEAIDPTDVAPANGRPDTFDNYEVVDWVLVGVRASAAEADGARAAALLLADGTLLNPATGQPYASVKPAAPGAYHVVVYHRSHLAAMSAFLVALDGSSPGSVYDLSVSPLLVYGSGVKSIVSGVFGLFAGDGDGNGSVLAPDQQAVWRPSVGLAGYLPGDFNLDGSVLADDQQVLWVPNVGAQSTVPGASSVAPRPGDPASGDR